MAVVTVCQCLSTIHPLLCIWNWSKAPSKWMHSYSLCTEQWKVSKWIRIIQVIAQGTNTCSGYMTCSGTQSCSCFNVALWRSLQFSTYKMIPFTALITVYHFVSAITQAAHTINLEAGCEWFAWVIQHFCWRERSHSSILKALKVVRSQLWVVIVSLCRMCFGLPQAFT